jgi:hypothetical protein
LDAVFVFRDRRFDHEFGQIDRFGDRITGGPDRGLQLGGGLGQGGRDAFVHPDSRAVGIGADSLSDRIEPGQPGRHRLDFLLDGGERSGCHNLVAGTALTSDVKLVTNVLERLFLLCHLRQSFFERTEIGCGCGEFLKAAPFLCVSGLEVGVGGDRQELAQAGLVVGE